MKKRREKNLKTIGTDMEFGLVNSETGGTVSAGSTFNLNEAKKYYTGIDGHSVTGEMRPDYFISGNFNRTFNAIKTALEYINKTIPKEIIVIAGCATNNSSHEPIGGHIHFGNVPKKLMHDMAPKLDLYMALPLMMLENPERARKRRRTYGHLSDIRRKEFHKGFEYRTPSSFILSPGMTKIGLALADIILQGTLKGKLPSFFYMTEGENDDAFYECNKDYFRRQKIDNEFLLDRIFREFLKLSFAKRYKMYLYSLKGMLNLGLTWDEASDILPKWGFRPLPFITFNSRDFAVDRIANEFLKEKLKKKIYIYGISSEKHEDVDVGIYGGIIRDDFITEIKDAYRINIDRKVFGAAENRSADIKIGFSSKLRENNFDLCKEIFGKIISKIKK